MSVLASTAPGQLDEKPLGREAVMGALIEATIALIIEKGLQMSVREIASRADVNHGLVHTYFDSKQGLLAAAADEINRRASAEADDSGFPPPDLAFRRSGALAKAMARIRLDAGGDLFSSHPVSSRWKQALLRTRPETTEEEADTMVATASALGLGWALFADHICEVLDLDDRRRAALDRHMESLVADLGGLPRQRHQTTWPRG